VSSHARIVVGVLGRVLPRFAVACVIVVTATIAETLPAAAWSNGGEGANGYGTHDWILDHALDALGRRADWVCRRAALRATDDPDTRDGIDHASGTWWHVWDEWGDTWGGAPEAVSVWFRRTQRRLDAGRECSASRALGIMSHFVADVAQPMHTDGSLEAEDRVHGPYESAVDSRSEADDDVYTFEFDGVDPARPRAKTLRVARNAHRFYEVLVKTYDEHGYNRRVARITQRQLERAANALADLIASLR
jgi:hypothetical protein